MTGFVFGFRERVYDEKICDFKVVVTKFSAENQSRIVHALNTGMEKVVVYHVHTGKKNWTYHTAYEISLGSVGGGPFSIVQMKDVHGITERETIEPSREFYTLVMVPECVASS